jgi:hypothetical protein
MAKPLQQDSEGNIINDEVTKENQKGYANYEADLKRQSEMEKANEKESRSKDRYMNLMKSGLKMIGMKKGGSVSSASKRADGCAIRGKTKGRMV